MLHPSPPAGVHELTPLEHELSFFHDDLGPGAIFFANGQLLPREHVPKCAWTSIPVVACHCPDHLNVAEAVAA